MRTMSLDRLALLATVAIAAWALWETREFYRITSLPNLSISYSYGTADGDGWFLRNNGPGFARVESFQVLVDGEPVASYCDMELALGYIKKRPTPEKLFSILYSGGLVPPRAEQPLYVVKKPNLDPSVRRQRGRVCFRACYCSLYGDDCWTESSCPEHKDEGTCSAENPQIEHCEWLPKGEVRFRERHRRNRSSPGSRP